MVDITLRTGLDRTLTHTEVDGNFTNLKNAVEDSVNIAKGPLWVAGVYTYGSLVRYGNMAYICVAESTTSIPNSSLDWLAIGNVGYLMASLGDTTITNPVNGNTLVYDSVIGKWVNKNFDMTFRLNFAGFLEKSLSETKYYPSRTIKITGFYFNFGTPPSTPNDFQIKKNGTLITTVNVAANTSLSTKTAVDITLTTADYLSVDNYITSGKNLSIVFLYE